MKIYNNKRDYSGGNNHRKNGELKVWEYIKNKFKPNIVFDVGVEEFSYIADNSLKETIVFLFEPNPKHYQCIMKKYSNFKNIHIHNFGFGNFDNQELNLYPSTGSIFYRNKTVPVNRLSKESVQIKLRTIDNFVSENNIEKIDFLKIDVEGYELNVLLGAKNFLEKINLIQFEYGGTYIDAGITLKQVIDLFPSHFFYAIEHNGLNRVFPESLYNETKYTNFLVSKTELHE